jgi:hypothetical protein
VRYTQGLRVLDTESNLSAGPANIKTDLRRSLCWRGHEDSVTLMDILVRSAPKISYSCDPDGFAQRVPETVLRVLVDLARNYKTNLVQVGFVARGPTRSLFRYTNGKPFVSYFAITRAIYSRSSSPRRKQNYLLAWTHKCKDRPMAAITFAGPRGLEPRKSLLESDSLPLAYGPNCGDYNTVLQWNHKPKCGLINTAFACAMSCLAISVL